MKVPNGMNAKGLFAGYKIALDDVPFAVLEKAIKDVVKGQAEGMNPVFLPTPAELAIYCRKIEGTTRAAVSHAQQMLDAPEEVFRHKRISPERLNVIKSQVVEAGQTKH